jgi:2-C-methyl-D-erythritol 2,4-cyclodiphosphate synthase
MARTAKRVPAAAQECPLRIGQGLDVHPLAAGRRLILGGVKVPHDRGLVGHSDADVLSHAVCDALLGALGLPDMGQRFPTSEARHRNRSSLAFLREIAAGMRSRGMELVNLDAVLVAEAPRLQPYLREMRDRIARALRSDPERIGIKVKRGEGLGALGRCEGMMAQAVVLLRSIAPPERRSRAGR